MKKRNNAGPRKFKAPKRKQATSQQQRYLSAKTKVFRVSPGKKGSLRNPNILFIKDIAAPKKNRTVPEKGNSYFFRPNTALKKVWAPKKKELKNIAPKKYGLKKKWVRKKRNSYFFGPTVCQKSMNAAKKSSEKKLVLFRAKHCAKKTGSQKKIVPKKGTHTFRAKQCAKKSTNKKGTHTFSGQALCQKKDERQKTV